MKKELTLIFLLFLLTTTNAQTAQVVSNLESPTLDESSGLLFYNNKIITHTDSGGETNLYEISAVTGAVTRTVRITNATNVDWEDIAQDASFIYIGDIGNNSGNRTDLKIYKISKSDYDDTDNTATAEIIYYSYSNQNDFTSKPNNNNWDAEGLISYGDKLLIFSKNWLDKKVNVYSIPKLSGVHNAVLESSYNTNGLITGAETSINENIIYLTGYNSYEPPFMYTIHGIPNNSLDIFTGTTSQKISNIVPIGNQVEAISLFEITPTKHRLYISNEKYVATNGQTSVTFPAKLWLMEINTESVTLEIKEVTSDIILNIFPNPFDKILKLSQIVDEITIFDVNGRIVAKQHSVQELSLENLNKGQYFAQIKVNNSLLTRKIIKK